MDKTLRIKWLLVALVVVVATVALVMLFRESDPQKPALPSVGQANDPAATMEGLRAAEFRQGLKRWDLTAVRAAYDKGREYTVLTEITLVAPATKSLGAVKLVAPEADFMNTSKNLRLPRGVTGSGDRRLRFSAGQALFSNASSLLTAHGQVRYEDELLQVAGDEMVYNLETRNLQLKRNVRATIFPRGGN